VAADQGEYAQARALHEESLALLREGGYKYGIANTLAALVGLAATTGGIERAVRLAGATDAFVRSLGMVLDSLERGLYDAGVRTARAQLDEAMFAARWAEGQAMTLEQVINYALNDDGPVN